MSYYGETGRGRGRGALNEPSAAASVSTGSSGSEHVTLRTGSSSTSGNGVGNGNENKYALGNILRTKPKDLNSKHGKSGFKVDLSANYFEMTKKPQFKFMLYRVDFEPECSNDKLRKVFVSRKLSEFNCGFIFDGSHMIYLTRELPQKENIFEMEDTFTKQMYKITVKYTQTMIESTDAMALMIYNTMLRRAMKGLKMEQVGRNLYDAKSKVVLSQFRLELWPGFITSIRQHEDGILTCVEVSHKVMRQETIYDILHNCRQESGQNYQEEFRKQMVGSIVLTAYNNNTYRVDDISFGDSPLSTFMQKGKEVSYVEYYKNKYNIDIRDRKQPMLISNPSARDVRAGRTQQIFLIPELSRATGLTDRMRSNFQMMRAMADHTQMDPERRTARLQSFSKRLLGTPESVVELDKFNMGISKDLVKFQGRALKQEKILYGGGRESQNDDRVDWTNPMKTNQMYANIPLKRWILVYPRKLTRDAETFWQLMREVSNGMNYDMSDPKIIELPDDRTSTYVDHLQPFIAKDPKLIVVIVPNNAADRYAAIKRITCVEKTIPTQVIVHKTMMPKKGNMGGVKSIATKVMIQINCKLGGAPWMISFPLKGVMTIGFDVTHDTRDKSKSFGAFVASMDLKEKVAYYSAATPHKDGNELSENIHMQMMLALKQFKHTHGSLPERIFFYRDGVGDGQIEMVFNQELTKINEKLKMIYDRFGNGQEPKFTFIIVNKRLNTRIFLNNGSNRMANPNSGTVVDNTITLPERYDFFLVSQSVRQGTVAPTSYNVIYDTSGLEPDKIQIISYKNTHLYYNWSGTTRVPAVVQYAHKLALLAGQSLHAAPNTEWKDQLYFL